MKLERVPADSITPALYADQAGLFKRYGLGVNISPNAAEPSPNVGLLVKADSPIKTAADLNGKTIAVSALDEMIRPRLIVSRIDSNGADLV